MRPSAVRSGGKSDEEEAGGRGRKQQQQQKESEQPTHARHARPALRRASSAYGTLLIAIDSICQPVNPPPALFAEENLNSGWKPPNAASGRSAFAITLHPLLSRLLASHPVQQAVGLIVRPSITCTRWLTTSLMSTRCTTDSVKLLYFA